MKQNRRSFLQTLATAGAVAGVNAALARNAFAAPKSLLVFTKSSGFEHEAVKQIDGKPSILENAVTELCKKRGYEVHCTKDGRIFDSADFGKFGAMLFFTTGNLTEEATDKHPAMSAAGKQRFLDAIRGGKGFVGVHAATDTFHTQPDPQDLSNRYVAHGKDSDPYLLMIGGEFIIHGSTPRLQEAEVIVNDPHFPGLEGVKSPVKFTEEWYSLKEFAPDMHVILTLDTKGLKGEAYERPPYPMTWARKYGKGRVFYTAIGDRRENWQDAFFLNLLDGGIRFAMGDAKADLSENLKAVAPGFETIPPKNAPKA